MITSTGNQKVKELLQLQKKSKFRNQSGLFIVEGAKLVWEAPRECIEEIYVTESYYKKEKKKLSGLGKKVEILGDHVFAYVSDTKTPQGILAVVRMRKYTLEDMMKSTQTHLLVLERLQDPGNVGTIFRTAEAAGVTGIVLSEDSVDLYNPKTIRSTMGAIYRMPFLYVENVIDTIRELKEKKIYVFATSLDASCDYDQVDYCKNVALLIGNEGNGLTKEAETIADERIKIPMCGEVESLNAAIAASVMMFEVARQRRS
jgi:TrmH family RNA methyltransferase